MEPINLAKPLFEPQSLNLQFIFQKVYNVLKAIFDFIVNPHTWGVIGTISVLSSIFFIIIIIFSLVRLMEIQHEDENEMNEEINEALKKEKEKERDENPKWHSVLNLSESPNESDWRIAIMEADSLLEESLKEKGMVGDTVADLLEVAREGGYSYIQDAWNAHLIRNKIAHQGSGFSLSKLETRRIVKMYQNFFEELGII